MYGTDQRTQKNSFPLIFNLRMCHLVIIQGSVYFIATCHLYLHLSHIFAYVWVSLVSALTYWSEGSTTIAKWFKLCDLYLLSVVLLLSQNKHLCLAWMPADQHCIVQKLERNDDTLRPKDAEKSSMGELERKANSKDDICDIILSQHVFLHFIFSVMQTFLIKKNTLYEVVQLSLSD